MWFSKSSQVSDGNGISPSAWQSVKSAAGYLTELCNAMRSQRREKLLPVWGHQAWDGLHGGENICLGFKGWREFPPKGGLRGEYVPSRGMGGSKDVEGGIPFLQCTASSEDWGKGTMHGREEEVLSQRGGWGPTAKPLQVSFSPVRGLSCLRPPN